MAQNEMTATKHQCMDNKKKKKNKKKEQKRNAFRIRFQTLRSF